MPIFEEIPCKMRSQGCPGVVPGNMGHCPTCLTQAGAPNLRAAAHPLERAALDSRYVLATKEAHSKGLDAELAALEQALEASHATVSIDHAYLNTMVNNQSTLYAPYQAQVRAGTRKPAIFENDSKRTGVEGFIFGTFGSEITYAALSADGIGLQSYGPVCLILRLPSFIHRCSLMEVNSYDFFFNYTLEITRGKTPLGYNAIWEDRVKLGVAKLAVDLRPSMTVEEFNALILSSNGDRALDRFIEIHIFGSFDHRAIAEVVQMQPPRERRDKALHNDTKDKAKKLGISIRNV